MTTEELAWRIRRHGIEMTHISHGSHIGSVLSVADIMAVLYNDILNVDPKNPKMENRDRFILSKGHAGASVYAALAEKGFFPIEELKKHYEDGSRFSGHVSHIGIPGIEFSTGSLGHGLPVACGRAYAAKKNNKDYRTFVVMSDGECDEGSNWEAALFANHFKLDNLVAIIDYNKMQSLKLCEDTLALEPFVDKWNSFGWNVINIDGHNLEELKKSLCKDNKVKDKPTVVIANTIKGKGISFMEMNILWHYRFPHEGEEYDMAVKELHDNMPKGCVDPYNI